MPQTVIENELFEILWDFTVETDHVIEARRPDMIVVDKMNNKCTISTLQYPMLAQLKTKKRKKLKNNKTLLES